MKCKLKYQFSLTLKWNTKKRRSTSNFGKFCAICDISKEYTSGKLPTQRYQKTIVHAILSCPRLIDVLLSFGISTAHNL